MKERQIWKKTNQKNGRKMKENWSKIKMSESKRKTEIYFKKRTKRDQESKNRTKGKRKNKMKIERMIRRKAKIENKIEIVMENERWVIRNWKYRFSKERPIRSKWKWNMKRKDEIKHKKNRIILINDFKWKRKMQNWNWQLKNSLK